MRILGVDYGDARTGLAVSDELGIIAMPLETYVMKSMRGAIEYVSKIAKDNGVELIVVGLPLNMDGTEGPRASKTRAFGKVLERVTNIKVVYHDERLTSVEAENILKEGKIRVSERKKYVDSMAARLILESYLEAVK